MARHTQTDQNNKFAMSLQYCKKQINEEVEFLLADKHESMLQIDTMEYGVWVWSMDTMDIMQYLKS